MNLRVFDRAATDHGDAIGLWLVFYTYNSSHSVFSANEP